MPEMTFKEQRFVEEMLINPDSTQKAAAIRAGYAPKTAVSAASHLMAQPKIKKALEDSKKAVADRLGFTQDRILQELAKIAFADLETAIPTDSDGNPGMSPLTEVSVETTTDKTGNRTRSVKIKSPKLADKQAALIQIGKYLGMFEERVEVEHTGSLLDLIEASYRDKVEAA